MASRDAFHSKWGERVFREAVDAVVDRTGLPPGEATRQILKEYDASPFEPRPALRKAVDDVIKRNPKQPSSGSDAPWYKRIFGR
jgi:hypothetical protein